MKRYDIEELDGGWECVESENDHGGFAKYEEAQSTITSLQAQLAERDKTILEQQAQITHCTITIMEQQARIDELIKSLTDYNDEFTFVDDLSALEAHDREVRIKCLENAADKLRGNGFNVLYEIGLRDGSYLMAAEELEFMANELKEQS